MHKTNYFSTNNFDPIKYLFVSSLKIFSHRPLASITREPSSANFLHSLLSSLSKMLSAIFCVHLLIKKSTHWSLPWIKERCVCWCVCQPRRRWHKNWQGQRMKCKNVVFFLGCEMNEERTAQLVRVIVQKMITDAQGLRQSVPVPVPSGYWGDGDTQDVSSIFAFFLFSGSW